MRFEVIRGSIKHNGAFYEKGSVFDADEKDVAHLIDTYVSPAFVGQPGGQQGDETETVELLTVEEFESLNASEQKELLIELGIEPGSNAETRLQQYAEFYNKADEE
jgi:hypothetical protein